MKYFEELMGWISGFLQEMLENFRKVLAAIDNSYNAMADAVKTYEDNTEA